MQEKYKKIALLGKGATAKVFLVQEAVSGKKYAMKVCENKELAVEEAKILQSVADKGGGRFPAFIEYLEEEGALIMEYLEGKDLQTLLDKGERLEPGEVLYIMEGILRALHLLHTQTPPIIYRDLKPANIMLCKDGRVCLIDLGAAWRETDAGNKNYKAGTYGYAAPEQFWEGARPGKVWDIYGAGKVFSYLLSGKNPAEPPYDVKQFCKTLKKLPAAFVQILERSLSLEPQARYADCESMWQEIYRASLEENKKRMPQKRGKNTRIYQKCIWKSEYQRIF